MTIYYWNGGKDNLTQAEQLTSSAKLNVSFLEYQLKHIFIQGSNENLVSWLVVLYVSSTARSFRDGTPVYCPLRRT